MGELWTDRASHAVGADRIAEWLVGERKWGPVVFTALVIIFDVPILSTIQYVTTGFHPILAHSQWPWLALTVIFTAVAIVVLRTKIDAQVEEIASLVPDDRAWRTPTARVRLGVFLTGVTFYFYYILFTTNWQEYIWGQEGLIIGSIKWFGIIPFIYIVIGAEFIALIVHTNVVIPLQIFQDSPPLNLGPTQKAGGLYPVGKLIQVSTFVYLIGLVLYSLATIPGRWVWLQLTGAHGHVSINAPALVFYTVAWSLGIVLFFAPTLLLHYHIKAKKDEHIKAICDDIRACGPDQNIFPDTTVDSIDDAGEYMHNFIRLNQVKSVEEYPVDTTLVIELSLPFIAHIASIVLFSIFSH